MRGSKIGLGSWIESIRKLDGRVEQINGHPAIDLTAKPAPTIELIY
ncbi:MAG: hypothetical protein HC827_20640 [Cyanobacteria bacterium RM1_2_2]|nr:hypothetical protein [Cyanobacteria bacterium RM1_2_2]